MRQQGRLCPGRGGGPTSSAAPLVDLALSGLIAASALAALWSLLRDGYLPQPFYYLKSDTLMDWFNTAYWSNRDGAYGAWHAIYPPLSLDFLRFFSLKACYFHDAAAARDCDWLGRSSLAVFFSVDAVLAYLCYRRADVAAGARALALVLGLPMLFALERGNLIIPCFACFLLSEGPLLRREWPRALAFGLAVNFKPYLIVIAIPLLAQRKWREVELRLAACAVVYMASYLIEGAGSPGQLLANATHFVGASAANYWNDIYNPTSYVPLLDVLFFDARVRALISPLVLAGLPILIIAVMAAAIAGALFCCWATFVGRTRGNSSRLATIALATVFASTGASGYAEVFVVYLAFLEPWGGKGATVALLAAFLLSLPADLIVVRVPMQAMQSWLTGREVTPAAGIALGQFLRPALLLALQFALVAQTAMDMRSEPRRLRNAPSEGFGGSAPA